jgi:hypothetical protein
MKKVSLVLAMALTLIVVAVFGQDSTAVEPVVKSGFWAFYDKYAAAIWIALGAAGVTTFLSYRLSKVQAALAEIVKAGEDNHYSEEEFQKILKAIKAIFIKKDA